jgi:alkyl hydroperoxide reductase subunit AhpF
VERRLVTRPQSGGRDRLRLDIKPNYPCSEGAKQGRIMSIAAGHIDRKISGTQMGSPQIMGIGDVRRKKFSHFGRQYTLVPHMKTCDVLIIGCGIAGASAALMLAKKGLHVHLLSAGNTKFDSN